MKTAIAHFVCLALVIAIFGTAIGEPSQSNPPNTFSSFVQPSPTVHPSKHHTNSSVHSNTSSVHLITSIHHNRSSIHPNASSAHHNHSTLHHNVSSSIMPSPSINFSISINMTSAMHNASHMTYIISSSHYVNPNKTSSSHYITPNATSSVMPSSSSVVPTTPAPIKWPTGKFSVKKGNDTCLLMWLGLEFSIKYKNVSSGEMITHDVIMPNNKSLAHATGACTNGKSSIKIAWGFYYMEATFKTAAKGLGASEVHWLANSLTLYAQVTNNSAFVDANTTVREIKETLTAHSDVGWLFGYEGHSFNCSNKVQVHSEHITASFENLRVEPFGVKNNDFSEKVDVCRFSSTTQVPPTKSTTKKSNHNTVAIAVGCSLAGLVLIVLIGYFIGRRRKNSIRYRKL